MDRKKFQATLLFGHLPGYETAGIARRPWRLAAHVPGRVHGWCCQCIEERPDDTWDEAVAPYILQESEWRIWNRITRAAQRRQWFRGRVAAKDAIRWLLLEKFHLVAPLEAVGILPDEHGKPLVSCAALSHKNAELCVSISHCGNTSVALATLRSRFCHGVGIDVASQTDDHSGLAEGGFTSAETALLDDCPEPERSSWLLRLWCAKEAAGKALGLGLAGNPLNYVVQRIDRHQQSVKVATQFSDEHGHGSVSMVVIARVGCDQGLAFAVARAEGI